MKGIFIYSFVITLILSLAQFNLSNAFGEKIDYKKLYKNHKCIKCHGFDGKGTKRGKKLGTPDFTDAEWQASVTDEQLINSITNGKKKMPKRGHKMTTEEIKAMVKYVRFFVPKKKRK
ncbi:MAG: cytochrome c-553 [Candidatus Scalindua rubra]|uniref:Cytochrome c-553 n=1 Tax=Candidatus Scalindua rubra TaxID=1872076 RepID=A0A1E3X660_9BACT|nr:MAG: cytochrome c-553 [Candidatus Scalindua rubra]